MHAVSQDGLERENHISFEVAELSMSVVLLYFPFAPWEPCSCSLLDCLDSAPFQIFQTIFTKPNLVIPCLKIYQVRPPAKSYKPCYRLGSSPFPCLKIYVRKLKIPAQTLLINRGQEDQNSKVSSLSSSIPGRSWGTGYLIGNRIRYKNQ